MRLAPFALILAIALPLPAAAQFFDDEKPDAQAPAKGEKAPSLFEEGARMMLRGLMKEMEPALNDMGKALSDIEPALRDMARLIDDIKNYDKPRMLPNGDILIPRRPGAPPPPVFPEGADPDLPPGIPGTGEIEL
ncbi:MAG: AAA+ family ATPase [Paracoccaceae bacterium]